MKNTIILEHGPTPYSPTANPVRLAVSPNAVWVLEQGLGKVKRIHPTSLKLSEGVDGIDAFSITATRAAVWLGGRTGVTRIDPETGQELEPIHVGGVVTSATTSITTGASGVWFVGSSETHTLPHLSLRKRSRKLVASRSRPQRRCSRRRRSVGGEQR